MEISSLREDLEVLWQKQKPFVAFCFPESNEVKIFHQTDEQLHQTDNLNCEGFVMTPFDPITASYFIPNTLQKKYERPKNEPVTSSKVELPVEPHVKNNFISLIQKALKSILVEDFKKVVLSRRIKYKSSRLPPEVFLTLLNTNPEAMVYLWSHPKLGTWLGASPEKFFKKNEFGIQTEALAGTRLYLNDKTTGWTKKEIEEQAFVSQQIRTDLADFFKPEEIIEHPPRTVRAGNLIHLSSLFELPKTNRPIQQLVQALHPTPAIGGIPKTITRHFILENEGYDRSFYTGFFGPVSATNTQLFVNLRCAQWLGVNFALYVGAGITSGSTPEKEWEETQRKAQTIAKVL